MTLAASILFDPAYVEAALLTAYELRTMGDVLERVHLVLLCAVEPGEDDTEATILLSGFCAKYNDPAKPLFSAITVKNTIAPFGISHFSNAIVYKAALPMMLESEPYLVNIDAGILPGAYMRDFLRELDLRYCQPDSASDWAIGAHCIDSAGMLPHGLAQLPANPLYPAGNVLLFNVRRYREVRFGERMLGNYQQAVEYLKYAEQELICLTATATELLALPRGDERVTPFLGLDTLLGKSAPLADDVAEDCVFFKFVGSLKPWKYWVLDPNKAIYTRRRAAFEAEFPLATSALVHKHRQLVWHDAYPDAFLEAYDRFLSGQGSAE